MDAVAYPQGKTFEAAVQFARTEGKIPAPETGHAIRAAIDEALAAKETGEERVILFNYSGHGFLDLPGLRRLQPRSADRGLSAEPPMFVKICGITNEEDALLATALDADALGFVFAPSKRQVDAETVRDIVRRLPREIHTIGVFRNERPERIVEIVGRSGLRGVQLHGSGAGLRGEVDPRTCAVRDPGVRRRAIPRSRTRRRARPTSSSSTRPIRVRARCSTGASPRARRGASGSCSRAA